MATSKTFLLLGLAFAIVLLMSSQVLAEAVHQAQDSAKGDLNKFHGKWKKDGGYGHGHGHKGHGYGYGHGRGHKKGHGYGYGYGHHGKHAAAGSKTSET